MKFNRVMVFSAALVAGLLLFAGCQKKEVVEVTGEVTTVIEEGESAPEEAIDLDEILEVNVPDAASDATTGDESFSGATTGADLMFDSATTGGDSEAINIEVIEEDAESASTATSLPSAFFFNI
ncbi:MAG: hypothetical protein J6S40_07430 [Thermoguttaceae bacterium]|nr:hypothetical protein [Thermoguttaceae bacterium]